MAEVPYPLPKMAARPDHMAEGAENANPLLKSQAGEPEVSNPLFKMHAGVPKVLNPLLRMQAGAPKV